MLVEVLLELLICIVNVKLLKVIHLGVRKEKSVLTSPLEKALSLLSHREEEKKSWPETQKG